MEAQVIRPPDGSSPQEQSTTRPTMPCTAAVRSEIVDSSCQTEIDVAAIWMGEGEVGTAKSWEEEKKEGG